MKGSFWSKKLWRGASCKFLNNFNKVTKSRTLIKEGSHEFGFSRRIQTDKIHAKAPASVASLNPVLLRVAAVGPGLQVQPVLEPADAARMELESCTVPWKSDHERFEVQ